MLCGLYWLLSDLLSYLFATYYRQFLPNKAGLGQGMRFDGERLQKGTKKRRTDRYQRSK